MKNPMERWIRHRQLVVEYRQVFGTEAGKNVLYDLMKAGHMLGSSFVKGDSHELAFREGERNTVLRILTILKTDPQKLQAEIERGEQSE